MSIYPEIPLFKVFMPSNASDYLLKTLNSGVLTEGPNVENFQKELVNFIGNPRVVPVNSCTTALTIAFKLAGIVPGTEVISTPLTSVAGNSPIKMLGGKIRWADIDPETGMINANTILPLINSNTKAIYVLHKEGSPAEIENIYKLANDYNLRVIEDAAHAFGARRNGNLIGSKGDLICFSFQAIKHITTGDGGALVCGNDNDYQKAKKLKWFGVDRSARVGRDVWHEDINEWGYKGNMNDIAASIGLAQMKHVNWILNCFNQNGRNYDSLLKNTQGVKLLKRDPLDFHTYWGYTLIVENRNKVIQALKKSGVVASQIHVRNDIYTMFNSEKRRLPYVDWFDAREVAIPCGWWVDSNDQERIVEIIASAVL
jgi:dTDP-4-amino-4,6-dideoxygalactose transaminase